MSAAVSGRSGKLLLGEDQARPAGGVAAPPDRRRPSALVPDGPRRRVGGDIRCRGSHLRGSGGPVESNQAPCSGSLQAEPWTPSGGRRGRHRHSIESAGWGTARDGVPRRGVFGCGICCGACRAGHPLPPRSGRTGCAGTGLRRLDGGGAASAEPFARAFADLSGSNAAASPCLPRGRACRSCGRSLRGANRGVGLPVVAVGLASWGRMESRFPCLPGAGASRRIFRCQSAAGLPVDILAGRGRALECRRAWRRRLSAAGASAMP